MRHPPKITMRFLEQFPEYMEFKQRVRQDSEADEASEQMKTPHEVLDASHQALRRELAQELLERVKHCSPRFFEQLEICWSPWDMVAHDKMPDKRLVRAATTE
jgi:restriction system protein